MYKPAEQAIKYAVMYKVVNSDGALMGWRRVKGYCPIKRKLIKFPKLSYHDAVDLAGRYHAYVIASDGLIVWAPAQ